MSLTFTEFTEQYHLQLTPQQQEAVQAVDGPVLVLAVPGAGKTTVLITRLGYMVLCCSIRPEQILTVTYTVAATKDMRRRFADKFGEELAARLEFRTINGICAKIIAAFGRRIGKTAFTLQTNEGAILQLLREFYIELIHNYPTESELMDLRSQISYIKNMQLSEKAQKELDEKTGLPLSEICKRYSARMRSLGQMDYDDQMIYAKAILLRSPELLHEIQEHYRYLCVDEAQDTSAIQHEILQLLAKGAHGDNLFLVGDEDQSIYGFRAAFPQALLRFEEQHACSKVLLMEDNFRSDASIVEAASRVISHNKSRHPKTMHPTRPSNTQVRLLPVARRQNQYSYLLKAAENCNVQTAVLYRSNESALPLIDLLDRSGLPYSVRNADLSFFSSRVVCDIANIYRFLRNPNDTDAFLQIYYKLNLYLSKQAALRCCEESAADPRHRSPLSHLLKDPSTETYVKTAIRKLIKHSDKVTEGSAATALFTICSTFGYADYLERTESGQAKLAILDLLAKQEYSMESLFHRLNYLRDKMQTPSQDCGRRDSFSQGCAAAQQTAALQQNTTPQGSVAPQQITPPQGLILSTIHASKGLEYSRVYLLDVGDGTFPVMDPPDRNDAAAVAAYEEERRIFYVGMTRARDYLNIFTLPAGSRFAAEMQQDPSSAAKASIKSSNIGASSSARASIKRSGRGTSSSTRASIKNSGRVVSSSVRGNVTNSGRDATRAVSGRAYGQNGSQLRSRDESIQENLTSFLERAQKQSPVQHNVYGPGIIQNITDKRVRVLFATGDERSFDLRIVVGNGILRLTASQE